MILIKWALEVIFKICGWPKGATFRFPDRIGAILFLFCSVVMVVIDFWYPIYVMAHNSSPDDRYGMFFVGAFPFYVIGGGISGVAFYRLLMVVVREQRNVTNGIYLLFGSVLTLAGFYPLLWYAWSFVATW